MPALTQCAVQTALADVGGKLQYVNSSDIVGPALGETERRLREAFATAHQLAKNATVAVFIDEIDALCPDRSGARNHESRVVAQLLTLMDGVSTWTSSVMYAAAAIDINTYLFC